MEIRVGRTDREGARLHSALFKQSKLPVRQQRNRSPRNQNTHNRNISRHREEEIEISYIHMQNLTIICDQKQIRLHYHFSTCQADENMEGIYPVIK